MKPQNNNFFRDVVFFVIFTFIPSNFSFALADFKSPTTKTLRQTNTGQQPEVKEILASALTNPQAQEEPESFFLNLPYTERFIIGNLNRDPDVREILAQVVLKEITPEQGIEALKDLGIDSGLAASWMLTATAPRNMGGVAFGGQGYTEFRTAPEKDPLSTPAIPADMEEVFNWLGHWGKAKMDDKTKERFIRELRGIVNTPNISEFNLHKVLLIAFRVHRDWQDIAPLVACFSALLSNIEENKIKEQEAINALNMVSKHKQMQYYISKKSKLRNWAIEVYNSLSTAREKELFKEIIKESMFGIFYGYKLPASPETIKAGLQEILNKSPGGGYAALMVAPEPDPLAAPAFPAELKTQIMEVLSHKTLTNVRARASAVKAILKANPLVLRDHGPLYAALSDIGRGVMDYLDQVLKYIARNPDDMEILNKVLNKDLEAPAQPQPESIAAKKIKIGIVNAYLPKGGELKQYMNHLLNGFSYLAEQGQVEVVMLGFDNSENSGPTQEQIEIDYTGKEGKTIKHSVTIYRGGYYGNESSAANLMKIVREQNLEVLLCHWKPATAYDRPFGWEKAINELSPEDRGKIKLALLFDDTAAGIESNKDVMLTPEFLQNFDIIYGYLPNQAEAVKKRYPSIADRVKPTHHGFFALGKEPGHKDPRFNPDEIGRPVYIGSLGKWGTYKRVEDQVEVARAFLDKNPQANVIFLIGGGDHSEAEAEKYTEGMIKKYENDPQILIIMPEELKEAISSGWIKNSEDYLTWLKQKSRENGHKIIYRPYFIENQEWTAIVNNFDITMQLYPSGGTSGPVHEAAAQGQAIMVFDEIDFREIGEREGISLELVRASSKNGRLAADIDDAVDKLSRLINGDGASSGKEIRLAIARNNWAAAQKIQPEDLAGLYYEDFSNILKSTTPSPPQPEAAVSKAEQIYLDMVANKLAHDFGNKITPMGHTFYLVDNGSYGEIPPGLLDRINLLRKSIDDFFMLASGPVNEKDQQIKLNLFNQLLVKAPQTANTLEEYAQALSHELEPLTNLKRHTQANGDITLYADMDAVIKNIERIKTIFAAQEATETLSFKKLYDYATSKTTDNKPKVIIVPKELFLKDAENVIGLKEALKMLSWRRLANGKPEFTIIVPVSQEKERDDVNAMNLPGVVVELYSQGDISGVVLLSARVEQLIERGIQEGWADSHNNVGIIGRPGATNSEDGNVVKLTKRGSSVILFRRPEKGSNECISIPAVIDAVVTNFGKDRERVTTIDPIVEFPAQTRKAINDYIRGLAKALDEA